MCYISLQIIFICRNYNNFSSFDVFILVVRLIGRTMVSNNINLKNSIPMQAGVPQPLPTMQGVDGQKIKQSVDNSYLANRVKASQDEEINPLATFGTGAAVWYGIAQGMDKLNPMMEGKYKDTILGKMGAWGDKVATNSTKSGFGKKADTFLRKMNAAWWKLTKKSDIAYSLANHSTQPESQFAKTPAKGLHGFLASDTQQVFEEFLEPISARKRKMNMLFFDIPLGQYNSYQKLEQYGVDQKYIDDFVKSIKNLSFDEKALALQKEELKLLGASDNAIKTAADKGMDALRNLAKDLKVKKLGFDNMSAFEALKGKFLEHPKEVMAALSKADKNIKISIWRKNGTWGKIKSHLFGRTVSLSEYHNKYIATMGKGNKTALGRFLPKAFGWFLEGTTNRFAGGKLAVAMQAGIFADMLMHTFKAPKGEKGKTFAERFINDYTYFMAMPLGIAAMHKVGGLKYAGLDKKGVEAYTKARELFNADVKAGKLADKALYKQRRKELNNILKAEVKNPVTRLLKKVGGFINIGNEKILGRVSNAKYNMNWVRKSGNFFRNLLGVPMRIAIPMMILMPFIAKNTTKISHFLFGKPSKSVLDEDQETPKQPELTPEQQAQLQKLVEEYQKQQQAQAAAAAARRAEPLVSNNSPTNLLTMTKNGQKYQSQIPQTNTTSTPKPTYTYIPSPEGVKVQSVTPDLTPVDSALQKADLMEQKVAETLSMRT